MLRLGLIVAAVVVAADQLTKVVADTELEPYRSLPVMAYLNLTLSYNTGAAFSFLAGQGGWQRWFFVALASAVSGYLIWWLYQLGPRERLQGVALALVLGGAVGNLLDRLIYGHVIDFIDVYVGRWHWPAFNLADSAISVGVVLLIITLFREASASR